jgi:hypothetical protein
MKTIEEFNKEVIGKSAYGNAITNAVIPFILLPSDILISFKGAFPTTIEAALHSPNFLSNFSLVIFGTVFGSNIFIFSIMTKQRKKGEISLPIDPNATWLKKSLWSGLILGIGFCIVGYVILLISQKMFDDFQISKYTAIAISAILAGISAYFAAFISLKQAAKVQ